MINAEELKNAMKEYFCNLFDQNPKADAWDVLKINVDLSRIVDDLDKSMWNPVEDSVPTDGRYILLHFENFSLPAVGRYEEDEDGGGAFCIGDDDESCVKDELFVNAWMDLPERYKGVK